MEPNASHNARRFAMPWMIAGTLAFALDLDVAVASVTSGVPGALLSCGLVVIALALAFFMRRLLGAAGIAALGATTLAVLLAISGLVDGSLSDPAGIAPSFVDPGAFATGTIALAIVVAVFAIARGLRLRAVSLIAALLAAYALGCVALALATRTPGFDDVMREPGPLPNWLHGAYLAGLLLIPAGIAGAIVAALRMRAVRAAWAIAAIGLIAIGQAILCDAVAVGIPSPLAFEGTAAAADSPNAAVAILAAYVPPNTATATATTTHGEASTIAGIGDTPAPNAASPTPLPVDRFENGIAAGRAALARSDFDVAALAQSLPNDPAAIDRIVRDHIALDVYPGAMRGARGTLIARAGNDDDRASLLAALLVAKGQPVRFARAQLSDAEVAELATAAASSRVTLVGPPASASELAAAANAGIDVNAANAFGRRHSAEVAARVRSDLERSRAIARDLIAAAGAAGKPIASATSMSLAPLLRTHTWVQVQASNGTWADLDTSLARLEPGSHLGGAATTLPAIPDADAWRVTVRLTGDTGAASPQTFASASAPVADVVGGDVLARIVPVGSEDPAKFENANAFRPEITGALAAEGQALDAATLGALKTLRLEIEIVAPGNATPTIYRRTLLSTVPADPIARAAALAQQVAIVVVPGAYNDSFLTARWLAAVHAIRPQLARLAGSPLATSALASDASLYPYPLAELAARDDLAATALSQSGVRLWRDRPAIYLERSQVVVTGNARRMLRAFDVVEDGMTAIGNDAALANATRGVYETHAEQTLDSPARNLGMLQVADAARAQGANLVVLGSMNDRAKLGSVDANATANLDETFAHGQVALAFDRMSNVNGAPAYGWWTLDTNGNTIGRLTGGGGQESEEYLLTNEIPEQIMQAWDVNQITDNCLGDGATTSSCAGEMCDTFASIPGEKALGAAFNGFIGGAIIGQVGIETKMLGAVAGEVGTNNTSGKLCEALYTAANGPPQSLNF